MLSAERCCKKMWLANRLLSIYCCIHVDMYTRTDIHIYIHTHTQMGLRHPNRGWHLNRDWHIYLHTHLTPSPCLLRQWSSQPKVRAAPQSQPARDTVAVLVLAKHVVPGASAGGEFHLDVLVLPQPHSRSPQAEYKRYWQMCMENF